MKDNRKIISYNDFKKSHDKLDAKKGLDKKRAGIKTPAKKGPKGWDTLEDESGHVGGKPKDESKTKAPNKNHFGVKSPKKRLSTVKVHESINLEAFYNINGIDRVINKVYENISTTRAMRLLKEEIEEGAEDIEIREIGGDQDFDLDFDMDQEDMDQPEIEIDQELQDALKAVYDASEVTDEIKIATLLALVDEYTVNDEETEEDETDLEDENLEDDDDSEEDEVEKEKVVESKKIRKRSKCCNAPVVGGKCVKC